VASLEVSIDAGPWQLTTGTSSWSYTWTLPSDGTYNLKSRALDTAGNIETPGAGINATVDNTGATVSSTDPADGAVHVAITATVQATFSEDMDPASITAATFLLHDGATNVAGTVNYKEATKTGVFTPAANLKTDTVYTATVTTGVKDLTGNNIGQNKVWSFVTVDTIPPTTTLTTDPITPDGGAGWFRSAPTVTLTASESATTYYQWDSTTGAWTTYAGLFRAIEGSHTLYYYSVDIYGNTETTGSQLFRVDTVSPTSAIGDPIEGQRMRGASYTIKGTSSDVDSQVAQVEVSTDGGTTWAPAVDTGVGFSTFEYTWTLPADGSYILKSRANDSAGNLETPSAGVTITVDNTPPVTTLATIPIGPDGNNGWFRTAPTISLSTNEPATSYYQWDATTGAWTTYSSPLTALEGTHTLYYYSVDVVSNIEATRGQLFKLDTVPPDVVSTDPANGAVQVAVTASISAVFSEDMDAASFSSSTFLVHAGVTYATGVVSYDSPSRTATFVPAVSLEGNTTYTATVTTGVKDFAGNPMSSDRVWSFATIDTIPPVTSLASNPADPDGNNGWFRTAPTITLSTNEPSTSYYQWDSTTGPWTTYAGAFKAPEGAHTLNYYSVDVYGNIEGTKSQLFRVDTIPPVTTLSTNPPVPDGTGGWFRTAPTITLAANELSTTYYQWDATTGPWTTYASSLTAPEGTHTLYYYSVDLAGNIEAVKSALFEVDTVAPVAEIRVPAGGEHIKQTVSIVGSATDSNFQDYNLYYGTGSAPLTWHDIGTNPRTIPAFEEELDKWNTTTVADGLYTLRLVTSDLAGNTSEVSRQVTVDNTAPTLNSATSIGYMAVDILFNETNVLDTRSAEDLSHYAVTPILTISEAQLQGDGKTVRLLTDVQSALTYSITVSDVKDRAGNSLVGPVSIPFVGKAPGSSTPQNVVTTAEPDPSHNVTIAWSIGSTGQADYYNVYRYIYPITDENKSLADLVVSHLAGTQTSYVDGTGIPGETYFYAVTGIDVINGVQYESPVSNSPQATVSGSQTPHILFSGSTNMCAVCHSTHRSEGFFKLERRYTVNETCFVCHDGTGSSYDIRKTYSSSQVYSGHKTQTTGVFPVGTQLSCNYCHNPHYSPSSNKFLMNSVYLNHDGTTKSLSLSSTRDFRDVCIICHENDESKPMTVIAGVTIPHITATQDLTHAPSDATYCKKCHSSIEDPEAAHSPSIAVKAPEAESIDVLGTEVADSTASGGYKITHTASAVAIEVVLNYNQATGAYLDIGNYTYTVRARVKSSTTTAQLKAAVNDVLGAEVGIPEGNVWQIIDLGSFALTGTNDNLRLGVIDPNGGVVHFDKVYFFRN
jgi:predicted CXXCH cytochrome family protein